VGFVACEADAAGVVAAGKLSQPPKSSSPVTSPLFTGTGGGAGALIPLFPHPQSSLLDTTGPGAGALGGGRGISGAAGVDCAGVDQASLEPQGSSKTAEEVLAIGACWGSFGVGLGAERLKADSKPVDVQEVFGGGEGPPRSNKSPWLLGDDVCLAWSGESPQPGDVADSNAPNPLEVLNSLGRPAGRGRGAPELPASGLESKKLPPLNGFGVIWPCDCAFLFENVAVEDD